MAYKYIFLTTCLLIFSFCKEDEPICCVPEPQSGLTTMLSGLNHEIIAEIARTGGTSGVPFIDSLGFISNRPLRAPTKTVKLAGTWSSELISPDIGLAAESYSTPVGAFLVDKESNGEFKGAYWADLYNTKVVDLNSTNSSSNIIRKFHQTQTGFLIASYEGLASRVTLSWLGNNALQDQSLGFFERTNPLTFSIVAAELQQDSLYAVVNTNLTNSHIKLLKCSIRGGCTLTPVFNHNRLLNIKNDVIPSPAFIEDGFFNFSYTTDNFNDGRRFFARINIAQKGQVLEVFDFSITDRFSGDNFVRTSPTGIYYQGFQYSQSVLYNSGLIEVSSNTTHVEWEGFGRDYGGFVYFAQSDGKLFAYSYDAIFVFDENTGKLLQTSRVKAPTYGSTSFIRRARLIHGAIFTVSSSSHYNSHVLFTKIEIDD